MNLADHRFRRAWVCVLALLAMTDLAIAFQPGDPPYELTKTPARRAFLPGPESPPN